LRTFRRKIINVRWLDLQHENIFKVKGNCLHWLMWGAVTVTEHNHCSNLNLAEPFIDIIKEISWINSFWQDFCILVKVINFRTISLICFCGELLLCGKYWIMIQLSTQSSTTILKFRQQYWATISQSLSFLPCFLSLLRIFSLEIADKIASHFCSQTI
jgi:hypothetical protein